MCNPNCNPDEILDTRRAIENIANWIAFQFPYNVPAGMSEFGVKERAQYGVIEMSGATPEEALERNRAFVDAFRAANPVIYQPTNGEDTERLVR